MLTGDGRRRLVEQLGPFRLHRVDQDGAITGDPVSVRLPDGTITKDVPLDVAVEPLTPGDVETFVLVAPGPLGGGPRKVTRAMEMQRGDSFTMPSDELF